MKHFRSTAIALFAFSLQAFAGSSVPGIHNFYKVDDHVYRGGQPTNEGLKYLSSIGVKTVLDLRGTDERSATEEGVATSLGMQYINVPMSGLIPPTAAQISKVLSLLEDNTTGAVFVHCKRGADRTGTVIAAYRIERYGWDNASALKEADSDGMSFFQIPRKNYIRGFHARTLEAKTLAKPVGGAPATVPAASASASTAAVAVPVVPSVATVASAH